MYLIKKRTNAILGNIFIEINLFNGHCNVGLMIFSDVLYKQIIQLP